LLRWDDVTFTYEQRGENNVLEHAVLDLSPGRVTVLTGPSGCGKSTLLYLAAGLYPKNAGLLRSGRVTVEGRDVSDIPPEERARLVGMMFQNPDLQFCMDTVKNELVFCLENVCEPPGNMDGIMNRALEFCGIGHLKDRNLAALSGGEKQKAMLACIVALNPKWLLLDEPFANIDLATAAEIAGRLLRMKERFGTGIVAVDHHLDVWVDIADEIVVMERRGGIALRGVHPQRLPERRMEELGVATPASPYQQNKPPKQAAARGPVLTLSNVRVALDGRLILNGCSARFEPGRIHAITGRSGSGKSTLFSTLCKLNAYEGSVDVCGLELKRVRRAKMGRMLGFVFQNPQDQFVSNSVAEELAAGLKKLMPPDEVRSRTEEILRGIGLWRYRFVSPYMLSQGQQRRLAAAALLAYRCDILVCDEPTYAQDRRSLLALMDSLQKQVVETGLTLIFSTHDAKLARDYADAAYELREGRLYEIN
jgi:energy-coupling factor transport system ATP-binding protein